MKRRILPGVLFLTALFTLSAVLLIAAPKNYSSREKRYLTTAPQVDAEVLKSAQLSQKLETWAADQFPFRDFFVGVCAYFDLLCGRNTAQGVLLGKNGRMFAAPAAYDISRLEANLAAVEAFALQSPVQTFLLAVPESAYIYDEALPVFAPEYRDGELLAQTGEALSAAQYIDAAAALEKAHETETLYYKTDHHLTSAGSYRVYEALCSALGLDPFARESFVVERYGDFYGTAWSASGYWLHAADEIELWRWEGDQEVSVEIPETQTIHSGIFFTEHLENEDKYPVYLDGNHALTKLHNDAAPEGTLILIKDSFAHCEAGFHSRHYQDIYLVDLRYYKDAVSRLVGQTGAQTVCVFYGLANLTTDSSLAWLR